MKILATTSMNFEAAHFLNMKGRTEEENLKAYGKCTNLHGHNYKLLVTVEGEVGEDGMVVNFNKMKPIIEKHIISVYDHHFLNDLMDEVCTAENMCKLFWEKLVGPFEEINVKLHELVLYETDNSFITIRGE